MNRDTKRLFAYLCPVILLVAPSLSAEEAYKIGVVDVDRILQASPQAKIAREKIEEEFLPMQEELNEKNKELGSLEEKLAKEGAIMSETDRRKIDKEVRGKRRELTRLQDEYREDFNYRRNEELAKIQKVILKSIQKVARQNGYDLVLSQGYLHAAPELDITEEVIENLSALTEQADASKEENEEE